MARGPSLLLATLLTTLAPASSALAQEAASTAAPLEEKAGPKVKDVERGFYVAANGGLNLALKPAGGGSLATGQSGGFELGYEPIPLLAIGAVVWGSNTQTPSNYTGICDAAGESACPTGQSSALMVGANARLMLGVLADANAVDRLFVTLRAGAGYSLVRPKGLLLDEVVVFGGPGIEWFTRMRHLSVGLDADVTYGIGNKGIGLLLQPLVKYTF